MIRKRVTVVLAVAAILFPAGCGRMKPATAKRIKSVEKQVLRLDSDTFQSFAGRYEVGPDYFLDVTWEDYYLVIQPTGQAATRFYAEGQTLFYSTDPYIRIQFLRDKGPVDGLVLWQQDFELQAKKVGSE